MKHLHGQIAKLERAEKTLERQRVVALNTYETINLASAMVGTMRKSIEELTVIQNMQLPEMLSLDTERVRMEFELITEHLRAVK